MDESSSKCPVLLLRSSKFKVLVSFIKSVHLVLGLPLFLLSKVSLEAKRMDSPDGYQNIMQKWLHTCDSAYT